MRRSARYYERLGKDFSVEKKVTSGTANSLPHIHDQYELMLCLSDDMRCDIDIGSGLHKYELSKNTLLLFNNMDQHHFYPAQPAGENIRYVLYFNPAYIDSMSTDEVNLMDCFLFRPFPDSQILKISEEASRNFQQLLDKLIRIQSLPREECYGKELYLQLILSELLLITNGLYRLEHRISSHSANSGKYRSVYGIINYIHTHYDERITLDSLASQFFMNKFYLCEVFKIVTGQSPNQYIINCRLTKAKELLRNGYTVENVCAMVGFNNMSHFSRTFKNKVGVSPKQYQQRL